MARDPTEGEGFCSEARPRAGPHCIPVLLALIAVAVLACARRPAAERARPPIIVISIDTLRSDHLPAYGYRGVATPAIDRLCADGTRFVRAYAHCPLTLPSHATVLSGRLPADNGIRDNAGFRWTDGVPSIAELLKRTGYATGAAVSSYTLRSSSGISRGFDFYDDRFPLLAEHGIAEAQRPGIDTERIAEEWIGAHRSQPFFFLFHLYEPHSPYDPPEPFRSRYAIAYDGEIATADAAVGRFLDFLARNDLYDRSAIILLSDHGEGLGEHGENEHGLLLYRESLQVPLIVKLPMRRTGNSVETPVQLIDVFPTIAELARIPVTAPGQSLLQAGSDRRARRLLAETFFPRLHLGWSDLHSVIEANNHLIRGTRTELFDIVEDPAEQKDLSGQRRRETAALSSAVSGISQPVFTARVSAEEARKLASLGYVGLSSPASSTKLPDPRDAISQFRDVRRAWGLFENARYAEALDASRIMLERNPRIADLWLLQAEALDNLGRPAEAMEAARRGLALNPAAEVMLVRAGTIALESQSYSEAEYFADLVLQSRPLEAHALRAKVALARGDLDGSAAEARLALQSGNSADVHYTLGRVALAREHAHEALSEFDKAQEVLDRSGRRLANLHLDRGLLLAAMHRDSDAESAMLEEIRLFPGNTRAYGKLIGFYTARGNDVAARGIAREGRRKNPRDPELTRLSSSLR